MAVALSTVMQWYTPAVLAGFDRGEALYQNHCKVCHETMLHDRDDRRARTIEDIRKWTRTWSFHTELDWSESEVNDVADYLNRRFYKFSETP